MPANRAINNQGDGTLFDRSAFVYQPDSDTYACPAGRTLVRKQVMRRDNCILYAAQDCAGCVLKPRCTTAARRLLTRHFHEDALQRMNARVEADPNSVLSCGKVEKKQIFDFKLGGLFRSNDDHLAKPENL